MEHLNPIADSQTSSIGEHNLWFNFNFDMNHIRHADPHAFQMLQLSFLHKRCIFRLQQEKLGFRFGIVVEGNGTKPSWLRRAILFWLASLKFFQRNQ
jgi:hypothetical protein